MHSGSGCTGTVEGPGGDVQLTVVAVFEARGDDRRQAGFAAIGSDCDQLVHVEIGRETEQGEERHSNRPFLEENRRIGESGERHT